MGKVFEIIPGTMQHEKITKVFTWKKQFDNPDFLREFKEKIGLPFYKTCATTTGGLLLTTIPNGQEKQFSKNLITGKNGIFHEAKRNSRLHKAFIGLIEKYKIVEYRTSFFTIENGLLNRDIDHYHQVFEQRFFIEMKQNADQADIEFISNLDFVREIPQSEFLRLQADYLDQLDKEAKEKKLKARA
jgi:hypothetical protein